MDIPNTNQQLNLHKLIDIKNQPINILFDIHYIPIDHCIKHNLKLYIHYFIKSNCISIKDMYQVKNIYNIHQFLRGNWTNQEYIKVYIINKIHYLLLNIYIDFNRYCHQYIFHNGLFMRAIDSLIIYMLFIR